MRERLTCFDTYPSHQLDHVCELYPGHAGPHRDGPSTWTSEASAELRERVELAQAEARERAAHNARLTVLGQRPPRGGLVGNRAQRRAGLRRGR